MSEIGGYCLGLVIWLVGDIWKIYSRFWVFGGGSGGRRSVNIGKKWDFGY